MTDDHFIDSRRLDTGARQRFFESKDAQISGAERSQCSAELSNGSPGG
jgi:hypothetical protein